ncbi:DUF3575 domain-containing protein [Sphingobacteriales bacterium UPWRP_1]|nr:hypothetical protein BVG80_05630 [Sphingobacteriales bacterium TSM_CSM]PSJ77980.1 DUF3575 domain-containing protein [Sphingobacteriales bacterium UPWRP_1]
MSKTVKYSLTCIFVALLCCFATGGLQAQHVVVKTNLLSILSGNYGATAEVAAGKKISLLLGGNYVDGKQGDDDGISTITQEKGYNFIPEVRFYFSNRIDGGNMRGLFAGPTFLYEKLNIDITHQASDSLITNGSVTNLGYGLVLGHQWIFSKHFAIELYINPYYNTAKLSGAVALTNPLQYEVREGIQFRRIGVALGFAF